MSFFLCKGLDGSSVYCNTLTHGKKTTIYLIKRILIPFLRSAKSSHHDGGNDGSVSGNNNFILCIPKMYCNNKENRCRIKAKQKVCLTSKSPDRISNERDNVFDANLIYSHGAWNVAENISYTFDVSNEYNIRTHNARTTHTQQTMN